MFIELKPKGKTCVILVNIAEICRVYPYGSADENEILLILKDGSDFTIEIPYQKFKNILQSHNLMINNNSSLVENSERFSEVAQET